MDDLKETMREESAKKGLVLSADDPIFILLDVISFWITNNNERLISETKEPLNEMLNSIKEGNRIQKSNIEQSILLAKDIITELPETMRQEQDKILTDSLNKNLDNYYRNKNKLGKYVLVGLCLLNSLGIIYLIIK